MRVTLELRRSYRLAALLGIAHVAAWAAVCAAGTSAALMLAATAGIAASLVVSVRRTALLAGPDAIVALEWNDGEDIAIRTRDGRWQAARLLPTTFVTPALTVLNVRTAEAARTRHIVLLQDSAAPDDYRRLRVRLQWGLTRPA